MSACSPDQSLLAAASLSCTCILGQHLSVVLTRLPADGNKGHLEETAVEVAECRGKSVERIGGGCKAG